MASSHDNFFVTTLIDRATGESARVRDMVNSTIGPGSQARITFSSTTDTATEGFAKLYAWTSTGADQTLTLSVSLLALGTADVPYHFKVVDEGGAAATNNLTIDTAGSETINGGASIAISTNNGSFDIYTNGTDYFAS